MASSSKHLEPVRTLSSFSFLRWSLVAALMWQANLSQTRSLGIGNTVGPMAKSRNFLVSSWFIQFVPQNIRKARLPKRLTTSLIGRFRWSNMNGLHLEPLARAQSRTVTRDFSWPVVLTATSCDPVSASVAPLRASIHTAVSSQAKICEGWTFLDEILLRTSIMKSTILCRCWSGVFWHVVVTLRRLIRWRFMNFDIHPSEHTNDPAW